jgi:hypothetical protein
MGLTERCKKSFIRQMKLALILTALVAIHPILAESKPVRVFILAGQSNMEGHGFVEAVAKRNDGKGSLEFLAKDPATAAQFSPLVDANGKWRERDDVWISYLERKGPLTVGYGARKEMIGPELGFGWVMGDACDEPVLLIKCAWGGKSLAVDFRPPSAGKPSYSLGKKADAAMAEDPAMLGKYYRETVATSASWCQAALGAMCFPALAGIKAGTIGSTKISMLNMKATWRILSPTFARISVFPSCHLSLLKQA